MLLNEVEELTSACPAQWEFKTDYGWEGYARYRWGCLRVEILPETVRETNNHVIILSKQLGGTFDGSLDWETVADLLSPLDVAAEVIRSREEEASHLRRFRADEVYRRSWYYDLASESAEFHREIKRREKDRQIALGGPNSVDPPSESDQEMIRKWVDEAEESYQKRLWDQGALPADVRLDSQYLELSAHVASLEEASTLVIGLLPVSAGVQKAFIKRNLEAPYDTTLHWYDVQVWWAPEGESVAVND